jgi:hypothetical protein
LTWIMGVTCARRRWWRTRSWVLIWQFTIHRRSLPSFPSSLPRTILGTEVDGISYLFNSCSWQNTYDTKLKHLDCIDQTHSTIILLLCTSCQQGIVGTAACPYDSSYLTRAILAFSHRILMWRGENSGRDILKSHVTRPSRSTAFEK